MEPKNDKGKFQAGSHPWGKGYPILYPALAVQLATMKALYLGFYTLLDVYNVLNAQ